MLASVNAIDICRSAKILVDRHREDAPAHAAVRAGTLLARGDLAGCRVWLAILDATRELLSCRPAGLRH